MEFLASGGGAYGTNNKYKPPFSTQHQGGGRLELRYEKLEEPVEVLVHFAAGRVMPLRFLWRGRAHRVETVHGRWTTLEGRQRCHHWAVKADGVGACELALDVDRMSWQICSIAVED